MKTYLTKEGLENLRKELGVLENEKRREVAERLREAASHGDLKENAAYDAAKEEQLNLEMRVRELRDIIAGAQIIEHSQDEKISIGSEVSLESESGEDVYTIVGPQEADVLNGKISFQSPLGEALIGKRKNDIVQVHTVSGQINYKIIGVK